MCSPNNDALAVGRSNGFVVERCDVKADHRRLIEQYDLVISAHCKQLFPAALVRARRCINIHPGLNPFNRGWFPQVFSILNGLPLGATIHEIDEQLDHGPIIDQTPVPLYAWDTSLDAYNRVQEAEGVLLERSIESILNDTYTPRMPQIEGNVNYRKYFDALRQIDLDEKLTFRQAIDRLRALTHGSFRNAYFVDPATGKKVYLHLTLSPEPDQVAH